MEDDNDFAYMRQLKENNAKVRTDVFTNIYLDKLIAKGYVVTHPSIGKITIVTWNDFGIVDYFPKANKVLIRKDNQWIESGNDWIRKNLIHEKQQNK